MQNKKIPPQKLIYISDIYIRILGFETAEIWGFKNAFRLRIRQNQCTNDSKSRKKNPRLRRAVSAKLRFRI